MVRKKPTISKMRVHFMGIMGSGIGGVADLARKAGFLVSGCDLETGGHDVGHLKNVDLVVVTPAVFYQNKKHPELVEGQKRGIVMTWQEFLGRYLQREKKVICVAGTHGKSSTTAMIGKLLEDVKFDPSVVVGAKVPEWSGNSRFGKGKYFVVEADEFFDNFLHYRPDIIILNNIEFDHPDYFKDEKAVFNSYRKFIGNLVGDKTLIINKDSIGIKKFLSGLDIKGLNIVEADPNVRLNLKIHGSHNLANTRLVYKLGQYLGIEENLVRKSLESFSGIGRRMELISKRKGVYVYDDYAHHPTAIKAVLSAFRELYPKNIIWVIVEPHGFNRTHVLLEKYKNVFKNADRVIIGPIFKARDDETFGMTPKKVVEVSEHPNAIGVDSFDQIEKIVNEKVKSGDVIVVMGAGRSNIWAQKLSEI